MASMVDVPLASAATPSLAANTTAEAPNLTWMNFQPSDYQALLESKANSVRSQFADYLAGDAAPLEVYGSRPRHFRNRARFAVARFDGELCYALFDKGAPSVAVREFPIATEAINAMMPRLLAAVNASATLRSALSAVHFLSPQSGDLLVTLIYGDGVPLDERWCEAARVLKASLGLPALLGRTRGQTVALDRDHVEEVYCLRDGRRLTYRQMEGSFSNPSAAMCEHTLNFLCAAASEASNACLAAHQASAPHPPSLPPSASQAPAMAPALLELYCGNGNHTVALAPHFSRVLAVEIDRRLCAAAEHNLAANDVRNASILCTPSGKLCKRLFHSLRKRRTASTAASTAASAAVSAAVEAVEAVGAVEAVEAVEAAAGAVPTVACAACPRPSAPRSMTPEMTWLNEAEARTEVILVDPPRCGLDADTLALVAAFDHILYISCNPSTLLASLQTSLGATHEVRRWAVFDHFAYTEHLEMGVLLSRRGPRIGSFPAPPSHASSETHT